MNSVGFRDRIVGYALTPASELLAHPANFRVHPGRQRDLLRGFLSSIGWIGCALYNQQTGHLIDGHERALLALQTGEQTPVPTLIVDLDEDEELAALASFDRLGDLAFVDPVKLAELAEDIRTMPALPHLDMDAFLRDFQSQHPNTDAPMFAPADRGPDGQPASGSRLAPKQLISMWVDQNTHDRFQDAMDECDNSLDKLLDWFEIGWAAGEVDDPD